MSHRRSSALRRIATRSIAAATAVAGLGLAASPARAQTARNALWYMGTYSDQVFVWDETTEEVVATIGTSQPITVPLAFSGDGTRLYVSDPTFEIIEVVDLGEGRTIDEFTLSSGRTRVWIDTFEPHPDGTWAAMLLRTRTLLRDRWQIDEPTLVRFDLASKTVTDTIPWPDDTQHEFANFRFSPDGELLYVFMDDLVALDAGSFEEVNRWELSQPLEPGMGPMALPFGRDPYQRPDGVYTGIFRVTDPVQNRRLMGIATVDLAGQDVDFYALGPSEGVGFVLGPDRTKAYGLQSSIGHYELWRFDLEGRRVAGRTPFDGRPRMRLVPSADGTRLFIFNAGNTIDVYDEATFERLRTISLDADMIGVLIRPDGEGADR